MIDKDYVKELCKKIWEGDYPDNNDGINQCKMDLQTVEQYIEQLEYNANLNDKLITALLDKVLCWTDPFARLYLTRDEILDNKSVYTVEYDEKHNAVIRKDWSCKSND